MDIPVTTAIRVLRAASAEFEPCVYDYVEHGGTRHSAECLGVEEHATVKTIVMETDAKKPFIVLMHGDCEISTKQMARALGVKSVAPCSPDTANRHTGYMVGGTLWYLMDINSYPLTPYITAPQQGTTNATMIAQIRALIEGGTGGNGEPLTLAIIILFIIVLIII